MSDVTTRHPQYEAAVAQWTRCRDVHAGSDAVKAGDYLPQPPGMDNADYEFYKARAQFFNVTARTIQALGGAVFSRAPVVEGVPEAAKGQLEDLTLRDEPLDVVAGRVVTELLDVGRYAILLDMPASDEKTGLPAPGARPYWATLAAESVINWKTEKVGADPEQLVLAVIRQETPASEDSFSHETVVTYRELALVEGKYQARVWTPVEDKDGVHWTPGPWVTPARRGAPLPFIPLTFVSVEGVAAEVNRPPLLDLVDVNIGHYRNSADHEHVLFWVACPTPWVAGADPDGGPLKIGSSIAWSLEKEGRAGMVEISGEGIGAIKEAMAGKERQMAALGARMLEEPSARSNETATAVRMRHGGDTSALQKISRAASSALTRLLRWHMWWLQGAGDIPLDVTVKLADDFVSEKATPEELKAGILAVQAGEMSSETFFATVLSKGWSREGVTFEEERDTIKREAPVVKEPPVDDLLEDPQPPTPKPPPEPPAPVQEA